MSDIVRQRTVNAKDAADAFVRGVGGSVRCNSALSVYSETAYSYSTPIATFDPVERGTLHITTEKYSVTTSKHVGLIRRAAARHNVPTLDTDPDSLAQLAR